MIKRYKIVYKSSFFRSGANLFEFLKYLFEIENIYWQKKNDIKAKANIWIKNRH